jgi:hypothetical protein
MQEVVSMSATGRMWQRNWQLALTVRDSQFRPSSSEQPRFECNSHLERAGHRTSNP